ncbi:30S ribosomal protein S2 [Candidatus Wolfebacteria bacterium]|nr:30S ribosomal protein S2 [Candidatus Wolfebacteria bacterium]
MTDKASLSVDTNKAPLDELFGVGAHYGYKKTRRHPSTAKYVFGVKNTVEIFDLEKTYTKLQKAEAFVSGLAQTRKQILFVIGKPEAAAMVASGAEAVSMPYVAGRWIGGTLTNFDEIRKRVNRLEEIREKKEKGELDKYTKHERLLMDREAADLEDTFGGLVRMKNLPAALFVIDPREERTAVHEAMKLHIPVVALANTDCDISVLDYPIPANDANIRSIAFFVSRIVEAYKRGVAVASKEKKAAPQKEDRE